MDRESYATDVNDRQWLELSPLIPSGKSGGRRRSSDEREIVNAIFYVNRSGCSWRLLPHDFPPWQTAYSYFRMWKRDGTWSLIHDYMREQVRIQEGRNPEPTAAIIDSQSVKTTEKGGLLAMMLARKSKVANAIYWSM